MAKLNLPLLFLFWGSGFLLFGAHADVRFPNAPAPIDAVFDTLPPEKKIRFLSTKDDERVEMEVINDQVVYLKINDRVIPASEYAQYQSLTDELRSKDPARRKTAPKPAPPPKQKEEVVVFEPGTKPAAASEFRPYPGKWPTDTTVVSHQESKDKQWKEVTTDTIVAFKWPPPRVPASPDLATALGQKLLHDGLITDLKNFSAELGPFGMKVNGKTQPAEVLNTYQAWYEQYTGKPIGGSWVSIEATKTKE
ncbi:MAG: hypothetical protein SFV52_10980 [Saprospiraceae bacterium]|nr:hypothetical protein [Saprospiraceae bacterium]